MMKSMSLLRWIILIGYLAVIASAIYGWDEIVAVWQFIATLLTPVLAFLSALLALKISAVIMAIVTLVVALLKVLLGFVGMVFGTGVAKALLIPQLLTGLGWIHKKSERIQAVVGRIYDWGKGKVISVYEWWERQNLLDKILLSGFLIPLFIVIVIIFVLRQATFLFVIKKFVEQLVQKTTKAVAKNFHRIPVIGGVPAALATGFQKVATSDGRKEIMRRFVDDTKEVFDDVDSLRKEVYVTEEERGEEQEQEKLSAIPDDCDLHPDLHDYNKD
jgi:hypothetical protein